MGNFASSAARQLHYPPEGLVIKNSTYLATQDLDRDHPAGRAWEQPEGVAVTIRKTKLIQEMVPQCLHLINQFHKDDPSGTMKCFLFHHPDFLESGDFLVTAIKSNEEMIVYALARTVAPIFVRQAILHANQLPLDDNALLYHGDWVHSPVYQQYEKKCRHITVICKLVDASWIAAFVYDILARGFECRAVPLTDAFAALLRDKFQDKSNLVE
jgi:hypothetical protein